MHEIYQGQVICTCASRNPTANRLIGVSNFGYVYVVNTIYYCTEHVQDNILVLIWLKMAN